MSRQKLSTSDRRRGQELARALKNTREERRVNVAHLAVGSQVSVDTIRSIESERSLAPGFFTVAALARELELDLEELARRAMRGTQ
jgi:transcriptional regulator with XRE-family HTH domain